MTHSTSVNCFGHGQKICRRRRRRNGQRCSYKVRSQVGGTPAISRRMKWECTHQVIGGLDSVVAKGVSEGGRSSRTIGVAMAYHMVPVRGDGASVARNWPFLADPCTRHSVHLARREG